MTNVEKRALDRMVELQTTFLFTEHGEFFTAEEILFHKFGRRFDWSETVAYIRSKGKITA